MSINETEGSQDAHQITELAIQQSQTQPQDQEQVATGPFNRPRYSMVREANFDDENFDVPVAMYYCSRCGRQLGERIMLIPHGHELVAEYCENEVECVAYRAKMRQFWLQGPLSAKQA